MHIIAQLRRTHADLLKKLDSQRNSKDKRQLVEPVSDFLKLIEQSSSGIQDDDERGYLLSIITFWSSFIYENTQKYPSINLRPFEEISETSIGTDSAQPHLGQASDLETQIEIVEIDVDSLASTDGDRLEESLRQELEQVRQHLEKQEWREAEARARQIEALGKGNVKEIARDLLAQAQTQLSTQLEAALAAGDAARAGNNDDVAQRHYREALELDPSNSHARLALQELAGLVRQRISKEHQKGLRTALAERRDIRRLEEAVYDAEALDEEGRLPVELVPLLKEARQYYNEARVVHGEVTTAMRFGDLAAMAQAVAQIQNLVVTGVRTVYDATTNSDRSSAKLLHEAQVLLQQASEETSRYEILLAEKYKTARPRYVHQRLTKALQLPLYEEAKRTLEEKIAEVQQYIQAQERAESLQAQASQETNPVRRLELLLQASQIFKGVTGLEEQLAQARPAAVSVIQAGMQEALQRAELFTRLQEYGKARAASMEAEAQAARWTAPQTPKEIADLLNEARASRQRIDMQENSWREYVSLAADIRQKVADQNQRAAGLQLLKWVSETERFKEFPDLRVLISEIDQYKAAGDQLGDAHTARDKEDWNRVFEITDKVLKTGAAGKLADRFRELQNDAVTELNIRRAQDLLEIDEIPEANNILSALLRRAQERGAERESLLRTRLNAEIDRIRQAIEANKPMQELYDSACDLVDFRDSFIFKAYTSPSFALRQSGSGAEQEAPRPEMWALVKQLKNAQQGAEPSPEQLSEHLNKVLLIELSRKNIDKRVKALQLFRYVGGMIHAPQESWPPYSLSLRTAEARRAARLMSESLRTDILKPLLEIYKNYQGKEIELKDEDLHLLADEAAILRETFLLDIQHERVAGRWAEVEWGKRLAYREEKVSNWDSALRIWRELDDRHPDVRVIKQGLSNARIRSTIGRAEQLARADRKEQALELLKSLQVEPEMRNSWELYLAIAQNFLGLGEFEAALANLNQAQYVMDGIDEERQGGRSQLDEARRQVESQRVVSTCSTMARNRMSLGYPADAIRILKEGINDSKVVDPAPLLDLRDEIFLQASEKLLQKAKEEQNKAGDEGKIQAITALIDLQTLEELTGQPDGKRRSVAELDRLRADLIPMAEALLQGVNDFDPIYLPLEEAIHRAASLATRLETFSNVVLFLDVQMGDVRKKLVNRHRDIASKLEDLRMLEKLLRESSDPDLWESAILTGDFHIFEQYRVRIHNLELHPMQEVWTFERRLSETLDIYHSLLGVIEEVRQKFIIEEDFSSVIDTILASQVPVSFHKNGETWQVISTSEFRDIRQLLEFRLHLPDVYGGPDHVGWESVLNAAKQRQHELELWSEWERECARRMDAASRAVNVAEAHSADVPTRIKKQDWDKVLEATRSAISILAYQQDQTFPGVSDREQQTNAGLTVGARDKDNLPVPVRSKAAKSIEEEGQRRKKTADLWVRTAQVKIEGLQAVLDQRGFPSAEELKDATQRGDWEHLENLLMRAREAGITNESERMRIETYARVLDQKRKEAQKKRFKFW